MMTRRVALAAISSVLVASAAFAAVPPPDKVPQFLQDISVTIKASGAEGSGVIYTRTIDGRPVNFVWTAAHVVDGLRKVEEVIDPATGTKRQVVRYEDARIVKELTEDGRRVGELSMDAAVVCVSKDEDLALLRVRKKGFVAASAVFHPADPIPSIGAELYHVGSLLGQMGANSMTSGILSQIGRVLEGHEFDQVTTPAFPGSSGGGVYLRDGRYIGMLVRGAGESFCLVIPVRRMRKWAERMHVTWAMDDSVPAPTEEQLRQVPIEDPGRRFETSGPGSKPAQPVRTMESKTKPAVAPLIAR